jgi:hypothetical protein
MSRDTPKCTTQGHPKMYHPGAGLSYGMGWLEGKVYRVVW